MGLNARKRFVKLCAWQISGVEKHLFVDCNQNLVRRVKFFFFVSDPKIDRFQAMPTWICTDHGKVYVQRLI
jgi:hypothetical protein